jgi:hypothetical protein
MIKIAYNRKAGPNPRDYSSIRIRPLQSVKITCTVFDRINTITQVTKCNRHWLIKGQLHSHPGPQMNQTVADKGLDLPDENTEPACWKSETELDSRMLWGRTSSLFPWSSPLLTKVLSLSLWMLEVTITTSGIWCQRLTPRRGIRHEKKEPRPPSVPSGSPRSAKVESGVDGRRVGLAELWWCSCWARTMAFSLPDSHSIFEVIITESKWKDKQQ